MNSYPYANNPDDMTSEEDTDGKNVGENDAVDYTDKVDIEDDENDEDDYGWVDSEGDPDGE